jgi:hypothetical protein
VDEGRRGRELVMRTVYITLVRYVASMYSSLVCQQPIQQCFIVLQYFSSTCCFNTVHMFSSDLSFDRSAYS